MADGLACWATGPGRARQRKTNLFPVNSAPVTKVSLGSSMGVRGDGGQEGGRVAEGAVSRRGGARRGGEGGARRRAFLRAGRAANDDVGSGRPRADPPAVPSRGAFRPRRPPHRGRGGRAPRRQAPPQTDSAPGADGRPGGGRPRARGVTPAVSTGVDIPRTAAQPRKTCGVAANPRRS